MYPFLGAIAIAGIAGLILFSYLASIDAKRENTYTTLTVLSMFAMVIGACGAVTIGPSYAKNIAVEHVALALNVPKERVEIVGTRCLNSDRGVCKTWEATFHVGSESGTVVFTTSTADITRRWIGELPPLEPGSGALIAVTMLIEYRILFILGLYAFAFAFAYWRMNPILRRRLAKVTVTPPQR